MNNFNQSTTQNIIPEINIATIKQKAIKGVIALVGRNFIMQAVAIFATFLLSIFLQPEEFGTFILVSAVISFFAYFSDIGLAGALIQKKDHLNEQDLKTTFTIQQSLVVLLILIVLITTPFFQTLHSLSQEGVFLLWALAFSLLLSSLKTIPSVLLERKLEFNRLIIPQILETILFNITAVYLAWRGFGITSFTYAVLVRGVSGLVLMYLIQPWKPGIAFNKDVMKSLLKFGLPYQVNTFLAVLKDDGITILLGGILGQSGVGFLGWAQKYGYAPLRFLMDPIIKVSFPAFSRLQHEPQVLASGVKKTILLVSILIFPSLMGFIIIAPVLMEIIPEYEKWQPALWVLILISINAMWATVTTPLTNMLNAVGKVMITFRLMVMWTVLTWLFVPSLASIYGVNGAAAGYAIVGSSSIIAILIASRLFKIRIFADIGKVLVCTLLMGGVLFGVRQLLYPSWFGIVLLICLGIITYTILLVVVFGTSIFEDFKKITQRFYNRSY